MVKTTITLCKYRCPYFIFRAFANRILKTFYRVLENHQYKVHELLHENPVPLELPVLLSTRTVQPRRDDYNYALPIAELHILEDAWLYRAER